MKLMNNIFFWIVWFAILIFLIVFAKKAFKNVRVERKAYEKMIFSTNDTTVAEFIKVFNTTQNNFASKFSSLLVGRYEDKIRYAQGYAEVANSQNVSEELKEQLKTIMLIKGVPIEL